MVGLVLNVIVREQGEIILDQSQRAVKRNLCNLESVWTLLEVSIVTLIHVQTLSFLHSQ